MLTNLNNLYKFFFSLQTLRNTNLKTHANMNATTLPNKNKMQFTCTCFNTPQQKS